MRWAKTVFWMLIFIFVILFSLQNKEEVILRFGLHPFENDSVEIPNIPLFVVILCSIFLGVLIGGLGDLYRYFQLKKALRKNQKMIEKLEKEIQSMNPLRFEKSSYPRENY